MNIPINKLYIARLIQLMKGLSPPQLVMMSFFLLIAAGTLLFILPVSTVKGKELGLVDSFFMATSATCVTGLTVINVDSDLTAFGKVVLFALMQLGGLGMMSIGTVLAAAFGQKLHLRERIVLQESFNEDSFGGLVRVAVKIVGYTAGLELLFSALFAWHFWDELGWRGVAYGLFHAASSFCNAGFDIVGGFEDISRSGRDGFLLFGTAVAILIGGLGFKVIDEMIRVRRFRRFSLHTKLVLVSSLILIVISALSTFAFESGNPLTIGDLPLHERIFHSLFMSVSSRTGGFSSFAVSHARIGTLLFFCIMMFIGASPASTGSGIKTTTIAVVLLTTWSALRGHKEVVVFGRSISEATRRKALAVFVLGVLWISFAFTVMAIADDGHHNLLFVLFETLAAFSTGFGLGITPDWGILEKFVIIATMFIGRVGIMTFALSLVERRDRLIKYPAGSIMIG